MKANSPQVWDTVWDDPGLCRQDELILANETASLRWFHMRTAVFQTYPSLQHKRVIEIGSGTGTYAAIMAKAGADVTLLDYSAKALARAKEFYAHNNLAVKTISGDALHLPKSLQNKFDISLSVGLAEHFKNQERIDILRVHLDVLKKGGIACILIPNRANPPYRIYKKVAELTGRWKFGEEYPFSRDELLSLATKIKATVVSLHGDELYSSLKFLVPANRARRWMKIGLPVSSDKIRIERQGPLDDYLSYCWVLILKKQ